MKNSYILIALLIVLLGIVYILNKDKFSEGFINNTDIVVIPFAIYAYNPSNNQGYGWITDAGYTQTNIFTKFNTDTTVNYPAVANATPPLDVATSSDITYYNANNGQLTTLTNINFPTISSGTAVIPKRVGAGLFYMKLKFSDYERLRLASNDATQSKTASIIKLLDVSHATVPLTYKYALYQIGPEIALPGAVASSSSSAAPIASSSSSRPPTSSSSAPLAEPNSTYASITTLPPDTSQKEVYYVDSSPLSQDMSGNAATIAAALNATVATAAQVKQWYDQGGRLNRAGSVSDSGYMYYTLKDTNSTFTSVLYNKTWGPSIILYGFKPSSRTIPANTITNINFDLVIKPFREAASAVSELWYKPITPTAATDADTFNGQYRIGYKTFINYTPPDNTCSSTIPEQEVYLVKANNNIHINDFKAIASIFGGTVATKDQITTAQNQGAQWCAYGAFIDSTSGANADNTNTRYAFGFPMQDNTFLAKQYPLYKAANGNYVLNWCGTSGVSALNQYNVLDSFPTGYGVIIYGVKPSGIQSGYTITTSNNTYSNIQIFKYFDNSGQDTTKEQYYRCKTAPTTGRVIIGATSQGSSSSSSMAGALGSSSSSMAGALGSSSSSMAGALGSSSSSMAGALGSSSSSMAGALGSSSSSMADTLGSSSSSMAGALGSSSSSMAGALGSSSSSMGGGTIGSSSSSTAGQGATNLPQPNIGMQGPSSVPNIGSSSSSLMAGLAGGWDSLFQSLGFTPPTSEQQSCNTNKNGRTPAKITSNQSPTTPDLPPQAPPLNMPSLLSTVASFTTSSIANDESSVMTTFIRKYGAIKRLAADDNDSILLIYTMYPNFYNNFYGILDENNKRIFRTANFDIQARLINSINQFNRDIMIALHYALDPNFLAEDVSDAAAAADSGVSEMDPAVAYNSIKTLIMKDIQDTITSEMRQNATKCASGAAGTPGAGGASGAPGAAGAAGASGGAGAGAGSGSVPEYKPPTSSSSVPYVISQAPSVDTRRASSSMAPSSSSAKPLGPGGCQSSPSSCPNCCGSGCNVCGGTGSPSLGQGADWKYTVLPSNSAAKCGGEPKKKPSLIWGE